MDQLCMALSADQCWLTITYMSHAAAYMSSMMMPHNTSELQMTNLLTLCIYSGTCRDQLWHTKFIILMSVDYAKLMIVDIIIRTLTLQLNNNNNNNNN